MRRRQKLGQQVEERGLARAIRADQRMDLAALHLQVDVAHRDETLEFLGQAAGFEMMSSAMRNGRVALAASLLQAPRSVAGAVIITVCRSAI